eukprot:2432612-Pyramimonas_sp.AAC.1
MYVHDNLVHQGWQRVLFSSSYLCTHASSLARALDTAAIELPMCFRRYPRRASSKTVRRKNQGCGEAGIGRSIGRNAHAQLQCKPGLE